MLRRLETLDNGTYRWELYVHFPDRQVHRHIRATNAGAQQIYADLVDAAARTRMRLRHYAPEYGYEGFAQMQSAMANIRLHILRVA